MPIKAVSFDVDGTLIEPGFSDKVWLEGVPKLYAESLGISYTDAKQLVLKEYERIGPGRIEWYDLVYWLNRFEINYAPEQLLEDYSEDIRVYPEVVDVLERLKERYTLVVASNAPTDFLNAMLSDLKEYFDQVFSAVSQFNLVKKLPAFYGKVVESLGIKPNELAHVGDDPEADFLIPRKIGIKACVIDRKGKRGRVKDLTSFERLFLQTSNKQR